MMEIFAWPCDPEMIEESIEPNVLISQFDVGLEQRRTKGPPRRRWALRFRKGQVDADTIWSFYVARRGSFEAFLWSNPLDGVQYTVRFERDDLSRTVMWRCLFEFGLGLVEVIT